MCLKEKEKLTQHETRVLDFDSETCPNQINLRMSNHYQKSIHFSVLKVVSQFFCKHGITFDYFFLQTVTLCSEENLPNFLKISRLYQMSKTCHATLI